MKKIFIRVPDTPAEIKSKITGLELEVERLKTVLKKNRLDLLQNHLFYDDKRITEKKSGLEETSRLIKSKELKISNLKSKLK